MNLIDTADFLPNYISMADEIIIRTPSQKPFPESEKLMNEYKGFRQEYLLRTKRRPFRRRRR